MIKIVGIAQRDKEVLLYYTYTKGTNSFLKVVSSSDGFQFDNNAKYVIVTDEKNREEKYFDWQYFQSTQQKEKYYVLFQSGGKNGGILNEAITSDLIHLKKIGKVADPKAPAVLVPNYQFKRKYVMYYGGKDVRIALSTDLRNWRQEQTPLLSGRQGHFDEGDIEVGGVMQTSGNILLLYYVKKRIGSAEHYAVGACMFDRRDPHTILWRSSEPLWEDTGEKKGEMMPLGFAHLHGTLILYWLLGEANVYAVSCPIPGKHFGLKDKFFATLLKKFDKNPIIAPDPKHRWESRATFNSAAVYEDGKVHFVYRALGDSDLSVLGYATSKDGVHIDERSDEPIYIPTEPFESPGQRIFKTFADHFASGGGYGGVEDPRITKIDGRFYMTYVAFDGANPPRVALTSIGVDDFLDRRWDKWDKPKLISAPGMVNKNAVIFPEKVNGKYVVYHRVYPNILVDLVDDLKFDNYLQGQYFIPPNKKGWDSKKVGAGAPPIKTKDGWLFIYQGVGYQEGGRYKIGAMMLDKNDPTKVLYRSNKPIVEPNERYENEGFKAGVVYPCGAVVKDGELLVYYGGADTVVCAASQNLDNFLDDLKNTQEPKLRRVSAPMLN